MNSPRNILLILSDQHCAEAMSCRSASACLSTPSLDRLARESTLFSRAYTASPVCIPARNSMFTGLYPHQTGILCNRSHPRNPARAWPKDGASLPPQIRGMGTYFADSGYDTAYFGKWHLNFAKGNRKHHGFAHTDVLENTGHDPQIAAAAAGYLESRHDRPFLAVVSFCDPHDVCQWADGRQLPGGGLAAPPTGQLPPLPPNMEPTRNGGDMLESLREAYQTVHVPQEIDTSDGIRRCRELAWGYHRLIERVDAHIGTVLNALDKSGHEDDTVVVYTSDHGEMLGAHGLVQKTFFYEESVHVPFLVRRPGQEGVVCDRLVNGSVDLLPSLLDGAGLPMPESLQGRSVWPIVQGNDVSDWRDWTVGQVHFCHPRMPDTTPHTYGRMVRSAGYSYWLFDQGQQRELLFDTESDPGETHNVASSPAHMEFLKQHRTFLRQHAERTDDTKAADMLRVVERRR